MNSSTDDTTTAPELLSNHVFFYIFLLLDIPSLLSSLLLFYYFFCLPECRRQPYSNQMIIYFLSSTFLINSINIPLMLPYFQGYHYITFMRDPNSFCIFWSMYDYTVCSLVLWLIALLSLERYLQIFFQQLVMKTRRRRVFLYYGIIVILVVFIFFWYLYLVALYPCAQTDFDFTQMFCNTPCYPSAGGAFLLNFDWIISSLLPVFLTILFTLMLILHVVYQRHKIKRHLLQRRTWKRTRKMFLQLVPITLIFLLFIMPLIILGLLSASDPWYGEEPYFYANTFSYCLPLLAPFAILSKQRTMYKRIFALYRRAQVNRIVPTIMLTNTRLIRKTNVHVIHA